MWAYDYGIKKTRHPSIVDAVYIAPQKGGLAPVVL